MKQFNREQNRIKIATCQTCHWPIYQGDLIHHSSTGRHSGNVDTFGGSQRVGRDGSVHGETGYYSGTSHTDQWVQCWWCLNEWSKELARLRAWKKKWWNWKTLLLTCFITGIIMVFIFLLSYTIKNGIRYNFKAENTKNLHFQEQ